MLFRNHGHRQWSMLARKSAIALSCFALHIRLRALSGLLAQSASAIPGLRFTRLPAALKQTAATGGGT